MISRSHRFVRLLALVAGLTVISGLASTAPASVAQNRHDGVGVSVSAVGVIRDAGHPDAVPGSYIVVLKSLKSLKSNASSADEIKGASAALAGRYGGTVTFVYTAALHGFAVTNVSDQQAKRLAGDPLVAYVTQNRKVSLPDAQPAGAVTTGAVTTGDRGVGVQVFVQPNPPSWGLDRIDERSLPLDAKYHYPSTARTARAYIINTGIRTTHQEFGGRAVHGADTVGDGQPPGTDCNGLGTHIAGTVGGRTFGVAKEVRLVAVRVVNCSGSGTFAGVIAGIDWVTLNNIMNPAPSVAHLSVGAAFNQPLNDAVTNSINANVHYSVAAGSSVADACLFSPGSAPRATTVAASDINDNRAAFTNFGPCVDLFAPGVNITSAWGTADNATNTISGTSTTSAHATGVAALWRHRFPADNADQVAAALVANATPGVIINPGAGSPNLLLFMGMIPM